MNVSECALRRTGRLIPLRSHAGVKVADSTGRVKERET